MAESLFLIDIQKYEKVIFQHEIDIFKGGGGGRGGGPSAGKLIPRPPPLSRELFFPFREINIIPDKQPNVLQFRTLRVPHFNVEKGLGYDFWCILIYTS